MQSSSHPITRILTSPKTYVAFSILFILYNAVGSLLLTATTTGDYWEHLAAMRAFAQSPFNPPNPYIALDQPTHLFTPYHLLWGVIANLLGTHPQKILALAAALNMLLFAIALPKLATRLLGHKRHALLLGATFLLLWFDPVPWSGFYNIGLLPLTAVYPYWFAFPIALIAIAHFANSSDLANSSSLKPHTLIAYIATTSLLFLIHPLTGTFLMLTLGLIALSHPQANLKQKALLAAVPVAALALAFTWPYFSVYGAIVGTTSAADTTADASTETFQFAGQYSNFYAGALFRILPAALGLFAILPNLRTKQRDFIALGFVATLAIYLLNIFTAQSNILARYFIYLTFFLQIGAVRLIIASPSSTQSLRRFLAPFTLAVLLVCGLIQIPNSLKNINPGPNSALAYYNTFSPIALSVTNDHILLAPPEESWVIAPIAGVKVIPVIHANPFLTDYTQRHDDTLLFFTPTTPLAKRLDIIKRHNATHLLLAHDQIAVAQQLAAHLSHERELTGYNLYRIR